MKVGKVLKIKIRVIMELGEFILEIFVVHLENCN
jgi:hypothetical protein